jgi:hypothetical protein
MDNLIADDLLGLSNQSDSSTELGLDNTKISLGIKTNPISVSAALVGQEVGDLGANEISPVSSNFELKTNSFSDFSSISQSESLTSNNLSIGSNLTTSTIPSSGKFSSNTNNATSGGLKFNFVAASGTPQNVIDGFIAAGNLWSGLFSDNVTVNINIGYKKLSPGVLGQTGSKSQSFSYSSVRNALIADATSSSDQLAISNLSSGNSFNMLINHTKENGNSSTPYLDSNGSANNTKILLNTANAKALGLRVFASSDGDITFSSAFKWDFDRSNGIDANAFDFIGVAAHEIGHALGFVSQVDILDYYGNSFAGKRYSENSYIPSVFDLFRYSSDSAAQGVIDFTADKRDKFFSLDKGKTMIAQLSTGSYLGDGQQASHWKDSKGIGIMDPTLSYGEFAQITGFDTQAFDVTGWNLI